MRQAGRILPEYREVRKRWSLMEVCRQPELCTEVTLQPVRRFPLDGAVMFADIMLPLIGIGVPVELVDDVGPVIERPIRQMSDLSMLRPIEPSEDIPFVLETIRLVRRELDGRIPLIGFSGAPFTLAAYLVEGRPSRDFSATKTMMYAQPALWHALMERLTTVMIVYLEAQVAAGADLLQLFDSWVGALGPGDYRRYVQPYTRRILAALGGCGRPLIHFGTNTAGLLDEMKDDGADLIGVDWRIPLDDAWNRIGHHLGIQGNLDPMVLRAPGEFIDERVADVLSRAGGRPGHIFNLGHGLHPTTPLEGVARCIEAVRIHSSRPAASVAPASDRG